MPFRSEKQRRFMWAEHPSIAKRWAREYPKQRNLPTYAHEKKKAPENQDASKEKEAAMARNVTNRCVNSRNTVVNYVQALVYKHANSAAVPVEIPRSEKPVAAGEESVSLKGPDQEGQLLGQLSDETRKPPVNETLRKLAVVLSQAIQQSLAEEQAAAQGQEAQQVPQNVNIKQYAQPASATPLPMGMAQAQSQQMQAAMPQAPAQAQAPAAPVQPQKAANVAPMLTGPSAMSPSAPPVGSKGIKPIKPMAPKSSSPMFNPIQSFGGLSTTGVINGNAGLGVQNSAEKSSADPQYSSKPFDPTIGYKHPDANATPEMIYKNQMYRSGQELAQKQKNPNHQFSNAYHAGVTHYGNRPPAPPVATPQSQAGAAVRGMISTGSPALRQSGLNFIRTTAPQPQANMQPYPRQKGASAESTPCSCGCGDTVATCKCGPSCKCRKPGGSCCKTTKEKSAALGLWDRIRMKKERGGKPAKPGDKDYPDTKSWKKVTAISEKQSGTPAWQRSAGKNEEGGLNEKGRKSYEREHGGNLKAPVTEKNPTGKAKSRQNSFCSRMCGMKRVNTSADTAKDPDSRINKSLRKWNCKCSSAMQFGVKVGAANNQPVTTAFSPYNAAKDTALAAGLSTAGTTAGLGAAALLSRKGRMPFLAHLFGNAAKESLLFFNPARSYRLVKRLPQAAQISAEQMRLSNKAFNTPFNARRARQAINNPAKQQSVRADINAARKVQRDSASYFTTHGEAPTETLEKGIGVANGVMNLGVGGAVGLLPHLTGAVSTPVNA